MIKAAVCDDEPYMQDDIIAKLSEYMKSKEVSYQLDCFSNGSELLKSNKAYDLLFLDIQMTEPNGLETAKLLRERKFCGLLIFITVLKECVFDSFEVEAFDYLLKPLEYDRFERTMDRALKTLEQKMEKRIIVKKGHTCKVLSQDEILYCEVLGRKIYLHTKDGSIIDYYCRLEEFEQQADRRFFRCHRSYLVNLDDVRGIKEGFVILSDGGKIPVSRLREQELTGALLSHMKERRH